MPYNSRTKSYYVSGILPNYTTVGNAYADVGTWEVGNLGTKRMRFTAVTNTINVQILGSFDDGVTYPITVVTTFAVAVATPVIQTITDLYTHLKVQADPAVDGAHGTLTTSYVGWSR
jgi:hypothetical protein